MLGIEAITIPTATETATPPEMTRDRTLGLAPTTEPTIAQSAPLVPFVRMQKLIFGNCIRKKQKT